MKFMLLVHIDEARIAELPEGEFDRLMHGCFAKADALREAGCLLDSQQLEPASTARTLRQREGRMAITDGPFAETKEFLAGFNLIEAADYDEALRIAADFPWTQLGSIEVRPVRDIGAVRARVGA
ncbi:YciI family protein [Lysobacter humi (ex Lee et al. 2017)]